MNLSKTFFAKEQKKMKLFSESSLISLQQTAKLEKEKASKIER